MGAGVSHFLDGRVTLHCGDCLDVLAKMPENSVDSVVTDPPYHLTSIVKRFGGDLPPRTEATVGKHAYGRHAKGFMGRTWDGGDIAFRVETWRQVLRVLKPGGYLLAFASTRGFGRMSVAIEDAGFVTHPLIAYLFDDTPEIVRFLESLSFEQLEAFVRLVDQRDGGMLAWIFGSGFPKATRVKAEGFDSFRYGGQALKPAIEPIYMGQKPFSEANGTANILRHGTGALNIGGCRIDAEKVTGWGGKAAGGHTWDETNNGLGKDGDARPVEGRWPANVIHDGSDEVLAAFPEAPGQHFIVRPDHAPKVGTEIYGDYGPRPLTEPRGDSGSAARFFYSAKADAHDRMPRNIEEVEVEWISEGGQHLVKLQVDTAQSLEKAIVVSASTDASGWNTFLCGSIIMEIFQKASKFTISTTTSSTTTSRIWSLLMRLRTSASIADVNCAKGDGGSPAENAVNGRQSITITLGRTVSLPGASHALSQTQLRISVSEKRHSHPTVKPLDLKRYLCRLVTPPGGTVLDIFAGTGTTGEAAWREGLKAILIEREAEYQADIAQRMDLAVEPTKRSAVAKSKGRLLGVEGTPLFGDAV